MSGFIDPTRKTSGIQSPGIANNGVKKSSNSNNQALSASFNTMQNQIAGMRSNSPTNAIRSASSPRTERPPSLAEMEQKYAKLQTDHAKYTEDAGAKEGKIAGIKEQIENLKFVSISQSTEITNTTYPDDSKEAEAAKKADAQKKAGTDNKIDQLYSELTKLQGEAGEAKANAQTTQEEMGQLKAQINEAKPIEEKRLEEAEKQKADAIRKDQLKKQDEEVEKIYKEGQDKTTPADGSNQTSTSNPASSNNPSTPKSTGSTGSSS